MTATHTRVHVDISFADPYLVCGRCGEPVTAWHDPDQCGPGCDLPAMNLPCEHRVNLVNTCPSWGPVDGCQCQEQLGHVPHPPATS